MAATIKDIARETGLSIATISKYVNGGTLKEKNRIAVERAIKKLDYHVNEYARGLKSNRSRTVGVIIPELSNLFVTQIITAMEDILRQHGYSVIICDCHTDEKLECDAAKFLIGKRVDGIINMPVCRDGRHLRPAKEQKIPVVLIDRSVPELSSYADSVLIDNAAAARSAVEHLLDNGHRRIGIIVGPKDVFTSQQRLAGFVDALKSHSVEYDEQLVINSDYTLHGGYESMRAMLKTHPDLTAIFVTNYEMTLGAVIAANEMGIKIPQELSLIGFDNMDLSRIAHPRLTIVTQPLEEIGSQVARILLDRLENGYTGVPMKITLSTTLQIGASVRQL
ncbi:LacI family DNA-binding transcriptional regulator [Caproiciproducens sp. LBM24188]|nr:LacI family transcriptional regulator [Oscillospiraceae bacterium]HHV31596.1 LacI family transcriptional regulator [Clostridiales bacterium]